MLSQTNTKTTKKPHAARLKATQAQALSSPLRSSPNAKPNRTVSTRHRQLAALGPVFAKQPWPCSHCLGQLARPRFWKAGRQLAEAVARRSGRVRASCSHSRSACLVATHRYHDRPNRPLRFALPEKIRKPIRTGFGPGGVLRWCGSTSLKGVAQRVLRGLRPELPRRASVRRKRSSLGSLWVC